MAIIDSRKKLKEYCLRRLGNDVIQIEISDDQAEDRIDDCIQMFKDFHYDGVEEQILYQPVTRQDARNGFITVEGLGTIIDVFLNDSNGTQGSIEAMDNVEWNIMRSWAEYQTMVGSGELASYYISREHLSTMRYLFSSSLSFTFNETTGRLYLQNGPLQWAIGSSLISQLDSGDWTAVNGALTNNDVAMPDGDLTGSTVTDTSGGTLSPSIENTYETTRYVRGLFTGVVNLMSGTYTGKIDLVLKDRAGTEMKRKTVQPTAYWQTFEIEGVAKDGHINDVVFEIETNTVPGAGETFHLSSAGLFRNNFYVLSGYKEVDENEFGSVWNVQWVKDYCTQLFKRQWASNLKKYDEIQMVGGVTVNGQTLFDEAQTEIERLEEKLELMYTYPPEMMWA